MELFGDILKFVNDNFIRGIFVSILIILFTKAFFKKLDVLIATRIITFLILFYSVFTILFYAILLLFKINLEQFNFIERAVGPYKYTYWFMIITNIFFPLLLFFKKINSKLILLLLISILMNIGWIYESLVILMSSEYTNIFNINDCYISIYSLSIAFMKGIIIVIIGNLFYFSKNKI
jgi:hypothetical protein